MSLITCLLEDDDLPDFDSEQERKDYHKMAGSGEEAAYEKMEKGRGGIDPESPLGQSRAREARLAQGLKDLAAEHGVEFAHVNHIDSRGEFSLALVKGQTYGPELADILNAHRPRTGTQPMDPGHLEASSNWCWMNHFDVEAMLRSVHIVETVLKEESDDEETEAYRLEATADYWIDLEDKDTYREALGESASSDDAWAEYVRLTAAWKSLPNGSAEQAQAFKAADEAHERWRSAFLLGESAPSYDELVDRFDSLPKDVQKLVDFVAEVYNGGISQALHNLGKSCISDVIPLLRMFGGKASEWALMLRKVPTDPAAYEGHEECPEAEEAEAWLYNDDNAEAMLSAVKGEQTPTGDLADSLLGEGGATPGFDIPMVLKVTLPNLGDKGVWYVETKPDHSKAWAINRVAAAMLRSGSGEREVNGANIVRLLRDHPPVVKDVSNEGDGNWTARSRFIPIKRSANKGY